MTAPEPPEVEAAELAAAERLCRWCGEVDDPGRAYWCCNERMGAAMDAEELRRLRSEVMARREQLARALPVVEAAGRVEALWSAGCLPHSEKDHVFAEFMRVWPELYAAVGEVVRAAREPRTGERK